MTVVWLVQAATAGNGGKAGEGRIIPDHEPGYTGLLQPQIEIGLIKTPIGIGWVLVNRA